MYFIADISMKSRKGADLLPATPPFPPTGASCVGRDLVVRFTLVLWIQSRFDLINPSYSFSTLLLE